MPDGATWVDQCKTKPRVVVVQMGARRSYETARMLEAHDALEALYTDAAWPQQGASGMTRLIARARPRWRQAILRRCVKDVPKGKIYTSLSPNIAGAIGNAMGMKLQRRYRLEDRILGVQAKWWGTGNANVILSAAGNGGSAFLRWAKARGLRVAVDLVVTPRVLDIVVEEEKRWPDWPKVGTSPMDIDIYREHIRQITEIADILLCPSQTVQNDVQELFHHSSRKLVQVPYAIASEHRRIGAIEEKRVLFAGQPGLRKGLPYLAAAASILHEWDPKVSVVIAGNVSEAVRSLSECRHLEFLGHLGQADLHAEMARADVFCLPTLAEGTARVVLEALAHGLPCVITTSAGVPLENGREGFIVPQRNVYEIASAVKTIVSDRVLRDRMSAAASEFSSHYALSKVSNDLYQVLSQSLVCSGLD